MIRRPPRSTLFPYNDALPIFPHLIKGAELPEPEHVALDENALRIVRGGLWAVVNEPGGTAYYRARVPGAEMAGKTRSEEHTSELQSQSNLVCRLLLEKKNKTL